MTRRLRIGVTATALLGIAYGLAYLWLGPPARADRYAVDGDTLEMVPAQCGPNRIGLGCRTQKLRLYGVDAFESNQSCRDAQGKPWPCGAVATARLKELAAKPDFSCQLDPEFFDRQSRQFAVCVADGKDVGAVLVSEGLAFAYGRGAQYLPLEAKAKADKHGAWVGAFVRPQYYRQGASD